MSETPICPVHKVEMRPGKFAGSFYCSKKIGPGPKDYCTERISASRTPAQRHSQLITGQTPSQTPSPLPSDALAVAAFEFAGRVFDGAVASWQGMMPPDGDPSRAITANEISDMALACFQRALEIARKP